MATPTLVQAVDGSVTESNNLAESVSSYTLPFAQPILSGNLAVFCVSWGDVTSTLTMSDDKGGTWTPGPTVADATNVQSAALFYQANVTSGLQKPKIAFSGTPNFVQCSAYEFYNVATSTPTDGSNSHNVTSGATALTAGSITTTIDGDLIFAWFAADSNTGTVNTWTAGTNFTLISANNLIGDYLTAEIQVQGTHGAINPPLTSANSIGYIALSIAFKAAAAGTAPTGNYIGSIAHRNTKNETDLSVSFQAPSSGNHPVIVYVSGAGSGGTLRHITGITDSKSNTWVQAGSGQETSGQGVVQIWYSEGATTASTLSLTVTLAGTNTGGAGDTFMFYDAFGLATSSSLDSQQGFTGTDSSSTSFTVATITPITSGCLLFTGLSVAKDTITNCTGSPSTAYFNSTNTGGETPPAHEDEDNGWAIMLSATTSQQSWTWTHDNSQQTGVGSWQQFVAAFKPASTFQPDEDFWASSLQGSTIPGLSLAQIVSMGLNNFNDDTLPVPVPGQPDEDYWSIWLIQPAPINITLFS